MQRILLQLGIALMLGIGTANMAHATQNGGNITITTTMEWNAAVADGGLHADGAGSDPGGTIQVNLSSPVDLSSVGANFLTAKGGDTGAGGTVTITQVKKIPNPAAGPDNPTASLYIPLDVLNVIKVGAGESATTEDFGGSISINSVECEQFLMDPGSGGIWPKTYWNCANPNFPTDTDELAWSTAHGNVFDDVRSKMQTDNTRIFVFANAGNPSALGYDAFFGDDLADVNGGNTFLASSTKYIYMATIETGSIGDPNVPVNYSVSQFPEVVAHELGHAVDIANGTPTKTNATWATYLNRDEYDINNAETASGPVTRNPCSATPGSTDTPPFQNVLDYRDGSSGGSYQPVCTAGGALNNAITTALGSSPSNYAVLAYIEQLWTIAGEINAQLFSNKAVGILGARPMSDQVVSNGGLNSALPRYLGCVESWSAGQLAGSQTVPPSTLTTPSGPCNVNP